MLKTVKDTLIKYRVYILVIAATLIAFVLVWNMRLHDTPMPYLHKSGVINGEFSISVGEIRRIDIHSSDGEKNKIDSFDLKIFDLNDNIVWTHNISKNFDGNSIELSKEPLTIAIYDFEQGIALPKGNYRIEAVDETGALLGVIFDIYEYRGRYLPTFILIMLITIVSEIVIIWSIGSHKLSEQTTFIIVAVTLSIFINMLFPPLAVPDEKLHFKQAYEISSNILHPINKDKVYSGSRLLIRATDYDSMFYLHSVASIAGWYEGIFDISDRSMVPIDTDISVTSSGKYAYIPAAIGITVARILGVNGRWLLIFGRLFNMLACIWLISLAIKLIPMKKNLIIFLALIPESLFLVMSYSYDGINLSLMLLFVSCFFRICEQEEAIRTSQLVVLTMILMIMLPIKVAYVPVCLLAFILPFKNFKNKNVVYGFAGVVTAGVIISLVFGRMIVGKMIPIDSLSTYSMDSDKIVSVGYAVHNIRDIRSKFFCTVWFFTNRYFSQIFGSIYGRAIPEDLDIYTMPIVLQWIMAMLFVLCSVSPRRQKNGIVKKTVVWFVGFLCAMLVLAGMLFAMTTVGNWRIAGFQGRYYLPALSLAPLAFDITFIKIKEADQKKLCFAGMSMLNILFWLTAFLYYAFNFFSIIQ